MIVGSVLWHSKLHFFFWWGCWCPVPAWVGDDGTQKVECEQPKGLRCWRCHVVWCQGLFHCLLKWQNHWICIIYLSNLMPPLKLFPLIIIVFRLFTIRNWETNIDMFVRKQSKAAGLALHINISRSFSLLAPLLRLSRLCCIRRSTL